MKYETWTYARAVLVIGSSYGVLKSRVKIWRSEIWSMRNQCLDVFWTYFSEP